jgi:hypothetical protein
MIKSRLRRLPPIWQDRLRRFSRVRWLAKARIVRHYRISFRDHPLRVARYVLLDPDVGDFSYEIDNDGELVEVLARALALEPGVIAGYLAEIRSDAALTRELAARVRWRPDVKRRIGLGHRVAWYVVARALKPRLVVETGIKHGIGSLVLLAALERNAREGSPGRLISFDLDPFSGWIVPNRLRHDWEPVYASTFDRLEPMLEGREVDLFICDTPPDYEIESFEMRTAMRHAAPGIVLIAGNGDRTRALPELTAEMGGEYHFFDERPRHDIYPGAGLGFGLKLRP